MAERKGNVMAVIDTFLKLMVAQKADRLVVSADEVPILLKGDETIELSMPTVPADIVANFAVTRALSTRQDDYWDLDLGVTRAF